MVLADLNFTYVIKKVFIKLEKTNLDGFIHFMSVTPFMCWNSVSLLDLLGKVETQKEYWIYVTQSQRHSKTMAMKQKFADKAAKCLIFKFPAFFEDTVSFNKREYHREFNVGRRK